MKELKKYTNCEKKNRLFFGAKRQTVSQGIVEPRTKDIVIRFFVKSRDVNIVKILRQLVVEQTIQAQTQPHINIF